MAVFGQSCFSAGEVIYPAKYSNFWKNLAVFRKIIWSLWLERHLTNIKNFKCPWHPPNDLVYYILVLSWSVHHEVDWRTWAERFSAILPSSGIYNGGGHVSLNLCALLQVFFAQRQIRAKVKSRLPTEMIMIWHKLGANTAFLSNFRRKYALYLFTVIGVITLNDENWAILEPPHVPPWLNYPL